MEEIQKIIKDIFQIIGFHEPEISIRMDNSLKDKEIINIDISVSPKEADYFIKEKGEGLSALQHIVRLLVYKNFPSRPFLLLDINHYNEGRKNELIELALKAAKKVRRTKKTVILEPMPANERRIIHLQLAEQPDIVTESIGQEPERKVMIRLYP